MIVVACNSASAAALDRLRDELDIPVVGVIEPGVRAARRATETGRVGVIGTVGTIASGAYQRAAAALDPALELTCAACPGFVEFVEQGDVDSDQVHVLAERLLAPVREAQRRHARARLHALPVARAHDRRRHGSRRRARVERGRDRVRGARAARCRRSAARRAPSRASVHDERRRGNVPEPGRAVPRTGSRRRGGMVVELTVLGCSGSYGAPAGGACSGYLVRTGDAVIWMDCGNGSFANLQQHVDARRPDRGRDHARASRPLRRHLRAARALQVRARARSTCRCTRPRASRRCSRAWWASGATRSTGTLVGDGDRADDRARRSCGSRVPIIRRPTVGVEVDERRQAPRLHGRHRAGVERRGVRPGRRSRAVRSDVPTRRHRARRSISRLARRARPRAPRRLAA